MSGLNKLVEQIEDSAKKNAYARLEEARQQADSLITEAKENAEKEGKRILQEADAKASDIVERARSAAALQKRRAILSAKQQMIEEVILKARDTLQAMPTEEYFNLIRKMVFKYALPQSGQIIFSEQDKDRLPEGFDKQLNHDILPKGGSLSISSESRSIDGGFVLVYGDIEENCTFEAVFSSKHDILQDKVHEFLFV